MANTAAAKKEMRASAKRAVRNRSTRSAVKTRVTRLRRALVTDGVESAPELATTAIASLDRAAAKGVLHSNNAARRKSRLQRRLNAALAGQLTQEPTKGSRGKTTTAEKPAKGAAKAASKSAKSAPAKKPAAKRTTKS
ncbi:MAG TPA: 30S ribosomal protein S20 [Candidatus Dormibacteraeota bacterium]